MRRARWCAPSPARRPTPSASRRRRRRRRRVPAAAGAASAVATGMNRFTWDMRYRGRDRFPGLIMWAASSRGPPAPPGHVSGARHRRRRDQDAAVRDRREPRLLKDVTDQDLQRAVRSGDQDSRPGRARPTRRCCRCAASSSRSTSARASSTPKQTAEIKALDDLETAAQRGRRARSTRCKLQSSQDPLNFPIKLNNKIAALQGVIESADVRPTEQTYSVFRTLSNGSTNSSASSIRRSKTKMPPVESAAAAAEARSDQEENR